MTEMMTDLDGAGSPGRRQGRAAAAGFAVALIGSAVIGLLAGLIWGEVAPRALLQEISTGTAELVNVETRAYIGADAWFCLIGAVAGLLTGILGYRFLITRRGPGGRAAVTAGLVLGAVAGSFVMLWLGGRIGLSGYDHELASSRNGTMFYQDLALGAKSALVFWPLLTSAVILVAEWASRREPAAEPAPAAPATAPGGGLGAPAE
jgi:hypothetical protein